MSARSRRREGSRWPGAGLRTRVVMASPAPCPLTRDPSAGGGAGRWAEVRRRERRGSGGGRPSLPARVPRSPSRLRAVLACAPVRPAWQCLRPISSRSRGPRGPGSPSPHLPASSFNVQKNHLGKRGDGSRGAEGTGCGDAQESAFLSCDMPSRTGFEIQQQQEK